MMDEDTIQQLLQCDKVIADFAVNMMVNDWSLNVDQSDDGVTFWQHHQPLGFMSVSYEWLECDVLLTEYNYKHRND